MSSSVKATPPPTSFHPFYGSVSPTGVAHKSGDAVVMGWIRACQGHAPLTFQGALVRVANEVTKCVGGDLEGDVL